MRLGSWILVRCEVKDNPPVPKGLSRLPEPLKERAREAYRRFVENPDHPGLCFRRIHSAEPIYSVPLQWTTGRLAYGKTTQ